VSECISVGLEGEFRSSREGRASEALDVREVREDGSMDRGRLYTDLIY